MSIFNIWHYELAARAEHLNNLRQFKNFTYTRCLLSVECPLTHRNLSIFRTRSARRLMWWALQLRTLRILCAESDATMTFTSRRPTDPPIGLPRKLKLQLLNMETKFNLVMVQ